MDYSKIVFLNIWLIQIGYNLRKFQSDLQRTVCNLRKVQLDLQRAGYNFRKVQLDLQQAGCNMKKVQSDLQRAGYNFRNVQSDLAYNMSNSPCITQEFSKIVFFNLIWVIDLGLLKNSQKLCFWIRVIYLGLLKITQKYLWIRVIYLGLPKNLKNCIF